MTNLSDLLPAGAASKQLSFTADGAIASGQTVALQTAGTVKAVGNFAAAVGSAQQYHASRVNLNAAAYDSNANKVLIIYNSDTSGDNGLYGVVGTVSGTSISYGTPVVVESGQFYDITNAVFDSSNNKIVFGYRTGTSSGVKMVVATISGTTVSFGSATSVEAASTENGTAIGYDVASGKIVVVYKAAANNQYVTGVVGTISGTSISFGTPTVIASDNNSIGHAVVYDPVVQKTVVAFKSGDYANAAVSTISGTSISFGSSTVLNNSINVQDAITGAYHSAENKIVFQIEDSSNDAHAIVCSVSGTSVTAESITEIIDNGIYGGAQNSLRPVMQYDPDRKKLVFFYVDKSYKVQALTLSLSGTSITVDGTSEIEGTVNSGTLGVTYDTSADKHIVAHAVGYASAAANTFTPAFTNVSSFLGIADAAISNAASGNITMKGGVAINSQLLPQTYSASLGSEAMFLNNRRIEYTAVTYDTTNDKVIVAYADPDSGSGVGMAAVGTVSGTSISWGTPVQFSSSRPYYIGAAFEATEGKVVLAYRDSGNSNYGYSVVGTVSGTSISFGTPVEWMGAATVDMAVVAIGSSKVVVLGNNNSALYGKVGTVSGTSISFGSAASGFGDGLLTSAVYDSNAGKVVVAYRDQGNSNYGTACVLTISGTSISLGTEVVFNSGNTQDTIATAFDPDRNEVGIFWQSTEINDAGYSNAGTVSGTSISFPTGASPFTATSGVEVQNISATYATNSNQYIVVFEDRTDSGKGKYVIGTSDGASASPSINFTTAANFDSGNTDFISSVYDPDQNTTVITYKDESNSGYGTAIGLQMVGATTNFTIGSTYYVQDDGTLSTTSSSVTAGKAIANTTLLLKG